MGETDSPPLSGTTDTVKPWTVKAIATEARDLAITVARREGMSTGQWLERVIRAAAEGGTGRHVVATTLEPPRALTPLPVPASPVVDMAGLAGLLGAIQAVTASAEIPMPKATARHAVSLMTAQLRAARGLPALAQRKPRRANAPAQEVEAAE